MSPKKLSPNNLTSTQLGLLCAAAQREDGAIELAPNLKGGAADKVVSKLRRDGLIEEIPARGALPIWSRDEENEAVALRVTSRGLARSGSEEHHALLEAEENSGTGRSTDPACNKPARRASAVRRKKTSHEAPQKSAVRTIFARYLELGSMGALLAELDRQGIKTKVNGRRDGCKSGGIRFGVGSLAHLLKNRFYLGEVTYRGEVHRGEHAPILGRFV